MTLSTKAELRGQVRLARQQITQLQWCELNEGLCRCLVRLLAELMSKRIFSYAATSQELDPLAALHRHMPIALPRIEGPRQMSFLPWNLGDVLVTNRFGINEPQGTANERWYPGRGDAILVPCLAVAHDGTRLGYGGGFYDSFLSSQQHAKTIGICLQQSVYPVLPRESHDIPLDWVVTETMFWSVPFKD